MIYGYNTISHKSSSNISRNPNVWSHSWAMRKPRKTTKKKIGNVDGAKKPLCWEKGKLAVKG